MCFLFLSTQAWESGGCVRLKKCSIGVDRCENVTVADTHYPKAHDAEPSGYNNFIIQLVVAPCYFIQRILLVDLQLD